MIMLVRYHKEIISRALGDLFSPRALGAIIDANLAQDNLRGQIGHDEFHFDNNLQGGLGYLENQRQLTRQALQNGEAGRAWAAFGRLTHTAQDFYAHTNYIDLWLSRFPDGQSPPSPVEVLPLEDEVLADPNLRTGKLYYPLEALSFIPALKRLVIPFLPRDSHAWMNLDAPSRGVKFLYAFEAAVKRTRFEFELTITGIPSTLVASFTDRPL